MKIGFCYVSSKSKLFASIFRHFAKPQNDVAKSAPLLWLRRICDFATSARRLPPPDVPPLRGRRTSIGFAKFPHASKLAEETSQSRRAVGGKHKRRYN